jgi:hypothetical protein
MEEYDVYLLQYVMYGSEPKERSVNKFYGLPRSVEIDEEQLRDDLQELVESELEKDVQPTMVDVSDKVETTVLRKYRFVSLLGIKANKKDYKSLINPYHTIKFRIRKTSKGRKKFWY